VFSNLVVLHEECHKLVHYGPDKDTWTS
jgi:hypothetical protein